MERFRKTDFCSFLRQIEDQYLNLTAFAGTDGEICRYLSAGRTGSTGCVSGIFKAAAGGRPDLYLCGMSGEEKILLIRPSVWETLEWQVFTEEGWKTVEVEDETCGFLRSGFRGRLKSMAPMAVWSPMFRQWTGILSES